MSKSNSVFTTTMFTLLVVGAISITACKDPVPVASTERKNYPVSQTKIKFATSVSGPIVVEEKANTIGPWNITAMASKVSKLIAIPETVNLKVGQELIVDQIKIHALDENNKDLGEVWGWSQHIDYKLFEYTGKKILAKQPGESTIQAIFSTYEMVKMNSKPPSVTIKIIVTQ